MNIVMASQVAICIPTYNQAQYLPESVGSACKQTYSHVEVWVCDDASTDATPEVMAELCRQFPQVHYHRHAQNLGIAANVNWLLRQPQTEFIVRLDSDDVLHPHYVETLLKLMTKYPKAGYAHAAVQEIDEHSNNRRVRRLSRLEEFQEPEKALLSSVAGYRVAANICMFRTEALQELNFTEGRPSYTEDYDLSIRMADAGYGNVYSNQIMSSYRVWTDAGKVRPKRKETELRGIIQLYEQSLYPAFERRGWDTKIIHHQRRQMAIDHAIVLDSPLLTAAEQATIVELLQKMGDSPALQLRLRLLRWGFGSYLRWQSSFKLKLKDQIKQWLTKLHN